ncbi:preprotein translocase subunit YajC [Eubacteriales bacterium OttesenSCG-928-K08]|nr:preprotein translocase subunit YajC [Eubacteriales bacterium OttesenSCG-928-K08]
MSEQLSGILPLILIMVAMFAVMIIPQRRRDKKVKEMLGNLKPGDRVRTIGGIYGTISAIKDDVVYLVVGPDKVRLVFTKGAISTVEDVAVENEMSEEVKELQ